MGAAGSTSWRESILVGRAVVDMVDVPISIRQHRLRSPDHWCVGIAIAGARRRGHDGAGDASVQGAECPLIEPSSSQSLRAACRRPCRFLDLGGRIVQALPDSWMTSDDYLGTFLGRTRHRRVGCRRQCEVLITLEPKDQPTRPLNITQAKANGATHLAFLIRSQGFRGRI